MRIDGIGSKIVLVLVAVVLAFAPGCYGPFKLTKGLHEWNGQVGDKWVNELVFLGLIILPVYALATIGDALIFNSIEFWTGDNPIDEDASTVLQDGDTKVTLARQDRTDGRALQVQVEGAAGVVAQARLVVQDGVARKYDENGRLVATAFVRPDGALCVRDDAGAERILTRDEIDAMLAR